MILHHSCGGREEHPTYQKLAVSNLDRQYEFLRAAVDVSLEMQQPFFSHSLIKALNFHAISCLHPNAGEYRPWLVEVGTYKPPLHTAVPTLMDDFISTVNFHWGRTDPVTLSAFVLWRLNYIHPFINGNGRTARAASYFVLCVANNGWLAGSPILPELITQNREDYYAALKRADQGDAENLNDLHALLSKLLNQQMATVAPPADPPTGPQTGSTP